MSSLGAFANPGDNVGASGAQYTVSRSATGWTGTSLEPPAAEFETTGNLNTKLQAISGDFKEALFNETPQSANEIDQRLYIRRRDGTLAEVGPLISPSVVSGFVSRSSGDVPAIQPAGASADLTHVLFSLAGAGQTDFFWPGDNTEPAVSVQSLYEYVGTGNAEPVLVGTEDAGHLISECGTAIGSGLGFNGSPRDTYNAISTDGAIDYFTSEHREECTRTQPTVNELYARVEGGGSTHTVAIAEPVLPPGAECTSGHACFGAPRQAGIFQGASENGRLATFLTEQPLLNSDEDATSDLYAVELTGEGAGTKVGAVMQVSGGGTGDATPGSGADVQGVARVSEDGSHIYFVAQGVLTSERNAQGKGAQEGGENLYVYEPDAADPAAARTTFITTLSETDSEDWETTDTRPVEATPDGRYLLFASSGGLTPDCPESTCHGLQLYRYDAVTRQLVRVSVGEDGYGADGTSADFSFISAPGYSGYTITGPKAVSISDDGAYVVFGSPTALTPQAVDDPEDLINNIYEYHEGHVYLITDGRDRHTVLGGSSTVTLIGESRSGSDVFFTTADSLIPEDTDTQMDIYDARMDGGFTLPAQVSPCAGEACQGALSSPPAASTPGSLSFSGPENLTPPPVVSPAVKATLKKKALPKCAKGKKRKHGRCVKTTKAKPRRSGSVKGSLERSSRGHAGGVA